ncbi:MAG: ABC transporter ATP-binding protein [Chloroflexota bacterium]|nr:ABC transporter ATP-binding protein [Chloroflexota bacterium]
MSDALPAIEVKGLRKRYGRANDGVLAVDRIAFEVRPGEVFGLLGPNGAGKTTTIRMLTGLTRPDGGEAHVLGLDLARDLPRIKKRIGVVPERSNLYNELSARENLIFMGQLYGVPRAERGSRADQLLRRFRLGGKREAPFGKLSKGMKRALTVAAALIHRPQLLFLDEPTSGLDVVNARGLRALIERLRDEGVTIFMTTHYLEEAERLADRVALLVDGRIVAADTVAGLKSRVADGETIVEIRYRDAMGSDRVRLREADGASGVRAALDRAEVEGREVVSIDTVQPSLEDAFIELTGLSAEVMLAEKGGG